VQLDARPFTVIGVAPPSFHGTQLATAAEAWIPLSSSPPMASANGSLRERRGSRWLGMMGRLATGVSVDQASTQIATIAAQLAESFPETNRGTLQEPSAPRAVTLVPANEAMVDPADRGVLVSVAALLMVAALLVLLIACANLASLELARGARRVHEVALRFSLGASRGRVVIPLLLQSGLLALVGGAAGVVLAHAFTPLILPASFVANWIAIDAAPGGLLDFRLLGFAVVLSLAAGTLCALAPALQASRTEPGAMLKSGASRAATERGAFGARNFLVVGQVALRCSS
jgi:predicted lysophospholipase L1 biosynthesis ABC-type transport system permease subunit